MESLLRLEPVIDTVCKIVPARAPRQLPEDAGEGLLREALTANPAHFEAREMLADVMTTNGGVEEACQLRLDGCMMVSDLFEEADNDGVTLEWEDFYTARALSAVYDSAMDHFLIGDFEMATAMLELLTDCDPEDHLNAAELLAFCYVALEEWELFDEIAEVLPTDFLSTQLVKYWALFRREGLIQANMKQENAALYREWTGGVHEISPEYLSDIESRRPSAAAEARRLWLRTEQLWQLFPEFVTALKA